MIRSSQSDTPISLLDEIEELKSRVIELELALAPFALMHRDGSDPSEMACKRGIASDATYLFSRDFERAASCFAEPDDAPTRFNELQAQYLSIRDVAAE